MNLPSLQCARVVRDSAIDAMGALNQGLRDALAGLDEQQQKELKLAFGRVMGAVTEALLNPAVAAYPELEPDEATWNKVVKDRAEARAKAA